MLSLLIPTYNEKENIPELLERIQKTLQSSEYEVIVVDDNSPDETWKVAEGFSKRFSEIRLIRRLGKLGLSSAFLDGLKASKGELVGLIDSDLQHPPEVLTKMLDEISSGADLVVASRYVRGGGVSNWPRSRQVISRGARLLANILLPKVRAVKDPMSGYFIIRRKSIEGIQLYPRSFKILLEILVKGNYRKVVEVPYIFETRKHGKSKLGTEEIWNYLKHLLRLVKETKSYLRVFRFIAVGLIGVVVNESILWFMTARVGFFYLFSAIIGTELAIVNNFVWNDLWTFDDMIRDRTVKSTFSRFLKFNISMVGGTAISLAVLWALTTLFGLNYLFSNLFAIGVAMLWNYLVSITFVWGFTPH